MKRVMKTYKLVWSPTGQTIATVTASTMRAAIRKAPKPYSKYKGEIYAEEIGSMSNSRRRNSRRRRNVAAGFVDEEGYFHPIRASYDYSRKRAGEKAKRKSSQKKKKNPRGMIPTRFVNAKVRRLPNGRLHIHITGRRRKRR